MSGVLGVFLCFYIVNSNNFPNNSSDTLVCRSRATFLLLLLLRLHLSCIMEFIF